MLGNQVWSPICDSCTRGPWMISRSMRGNLGKDSHHPQFPPLPLLAYPWLQTFSVLYFHFWNCWRWAPPHYTCSAWLGHVWTLISWLPSVALLGSVQWCILSLTITTTSSLCVFFLSFYFDCFWYCLSFVQWYCHLNSVRIWIQKCWLFF